MPLLASVSDWSELIRALASLAWPGLLLGVVFAFRSEVRGFLGRVVRAKGPGFELEAREVERAAAVIASATPKPDGVLRTAAVTAVIADTVPGQAKDSPKVRLARLSTRLDTLSRAILASSNDPANWEERTLYERVQALDPNPFVRASTLQFQNLADRVLADPVASDDDARRALEAGRSLLIALERIPYERHFVKQTDVELYGDVDGTQRLSDSRAVLLESILPDGSLQQRVFPARATYDAGQQVTWEWGPRTYDEAYYRNPDSGTIEKAWDWSSEFCGRPLDELD